MPLTLTVLASSSEANCCLVRSEKTTIMVDCGLPRSRCIKALAEIGVDPESITAVVVSHEHGDHIAGLEGFAGRLNIPVLCSRNTADVLRATGCSLQRWDPARREIGLGIGGITIYPFIIPHDACDPHGFRFVSNDDGHAISYATDLGWIPADVENCLLDADTMLIEANYDQDMLVQSPRPKNQKMRVASGAGHLSNDQVCELLAKIDKRPSKVVLAHVSEITNDGELALLMAKRAVNGKNVQVVLAREVIGEPI